MKHVILFSGGLDSWVTLACCIDKYPAKDVTLLGLNTGARIAAPEIQSTRLAGAHYGVDVVIDKCSFPAVQKHPLWTEGLFLAHKESIVPGSRGWRMFVLPYRNVVFLAHAALLAGALGAEKVWAGFDYERAGGSSRDKSPEFVAAWTKAMHACEEPNKHFEIVTPLQGMPKHSIIAKGRSLAVPFAKSFSCYNLASGHGCGVCASCVDRLTGFRQLGMLDPAPYDPSFLSILLSDGRKERAIWRGAWRKSGHYPVFAERRHVGWEDA